MYSERSSGRDERDSPYGRQQRDDRYRPRSGSRSRSRERDRAYDRRFSPIPPARRRSITPDHQHTNNNTLRPVDTRAEGGRYPRSRRSDSGSPLSRDDRDRMGRSRGSSRSRSPAPRRRRSPSPSANADGQRFRRENTYRPAYESTPGREREREREQAPASRNWTRPPSWQPRGGHPQGGHQQRPPYEHRESSSTNVPPQRTPPTNTPSTAHHGYTAGQVASTPADAPTDAPPSGPSAHSGPSAPVGPASWRRAQQFNQRPAFPDHRQSHPYNRGGPPTNHNQRDSARQQSFTPQGPAPSPPQPQQSSNFLRSSIPTGPRAYTRPSESFKKDYISPVADLKEKVPPSLSTPI